MRARRLILQLRAIEVDRGNVTVGPADRELERVRRSSINHVRGGASGETKSSRGRFGKQCQRGNGKRLEKHPVLSAKISLQLSLHRRAVDHPVIYHRDITDTHAETLHAERWRYVSCWHSVPAYGVALRRALDLAIVPPMHGVSGFLAVARYPRWGRSLCRTGAEASALQK